MVVNLADDHFAIVDAVIVSYRLPASGNTDLLVINIKTLFILLFFALQASWAPGTRFTTNNRYRNVKSKCSKVFPSLKLKTMFKHKDSHTISKGDNMGKYVLTLKYCISNSTLIN